LTTFGFKPPSKKFQIDLNIHWFGKQRLPDTHSSDPEFQRPDFSDPYLIANTQVTYYWKNFEFYTGCENLFDFRQLQPIISWQDPFGPYFDTSSVWGPTRGREIYLGVRYKIEKEE
ncbi:MAG: TonB-dependent receptor, partial [Bacteroidetes bacterium]